MVDKRTQIVHGSSGGSWTRRHLTKKQVRALDKAAIKEGLRDYYWQPKTVEELE